MSQYINVSSSINSVTVSDASSYLAAGDEVRLRIRNNNSSTVTISGWTGFKNINDISLTPTQKVLIRFVYDGDSLVATGVSQYL